MQNNALSKQTAHLNIKIPYQVKRFHSILVKTLQKEELSSLHNQPSEAERQLAERNAVAPAQKRTRSNYLQPLEPRISDGEPRSSASNM